MTPKPAVRLRATSLADAEQMNQVYMRNGMGPLDPAAWRTWYESCPFAADFEGIPIGWVLELGDGSLVGSITNLQMLYEFSGRRLKATMASAWAVDRAYRSSALQLQGAFYRQRGVDLLINGSANDITSQLLTAMKVPRMPLPDYGRPCFWAVRPAAFAKAALVRRSVPAASFLAIPAGWAVWLRNQLTGSGRGRLSSTVRRVKEFDCRFDELWERIRSGPARLRAVRTQAVLEWRLQAELRSTSTIILVAERKEGMCGYAVLVRRPTQELAMDLFDVMDLQAADDDETVYRDLLISAARTVKSMGGDAVKLATGTPSKRRPAEQLRPFTYQVQTWSLYFKTDSPSIRESLARSDAWDFSLFDTF